MALLKADEEVFAATSDISTLRQRRVELASELAGITAEIKLKAAALAVKKRSAAALRRQVAAAAARDAKAASLLAVRSAARDAKSAELLVRRQEKTADLRVRRQEKTAALASARQERKRKLATDAAARVAKRQRTKFVRSAVKHRGLVFDSVDLGGNAMGPMALGDMFASEELQGKFCTELITRFGLSGKRKSMSKSVTVFRDTEWHGCRRGDLPAYSADTDEWDSEEEADTEATAAYLME